MNVVGIMQPYIFPYIGYFQLVNAVDLFVFYDDVQFIKRGWINRNKILVKGQEKLITFPCIRASPTKRIKDVEIDLGNRGFQKLHKTISESYQKAPFFEDVFPIVQKIFDSECTNIGELASESVILCANYLELKTKFSFSSHKYADSKKMKRADRLIHITRSEGSNRYINAIGGQELYDKEYFRANGINLSFLNPKIDEYVQYGGDFVPGLSIIDVLMFNSKSRVKEMLSNYNLI